MGLAHVIGPEEREWFRRCRRAWDFGSPNRRNLEPRSSCSSADVARAVRMALAVWYFPGMWEWPRPVVQPRAMQAFEEAVAAQVVGDEPPTAASGGGKAAAGVGEGRPAPKEAVDAARVMLERYFAWARTVDAFTPVRVEADFEAGIPDPDHPGLELVDLDGRPVRYHDRIHVLVVDARDAYWVMEHRLVDDGWADRDELLLAERPVAAAWGWEQFYLGMEFAGTVHNEFLLPTLDLPSPPADDPAGASDAGDEPGSGRRPARHPRSRDWARPRAAERAAPGAEPADSSPAGVKVEEDGDGWFRRTWIRRTRAEIDVVGGHLSAEALDMLDPGLRLYPSPMPEHCGRCDFCALCLALNAGVDAEPLLDDRYQLRQERGPEEGRLGGGSWSMNRGAASPPQWRKPPT